MPPQAPDAPQANPPDEKKASFGKAFIRFLGEEKRWWIVPLLLSLLALIVLALYRVQRVAPFIYHLE
jgi:hypothetical protein